MIDSPRHNDVLTTRTEPADRLGAMASANFDRNDMILLETALVMHLPVVSLNAARLRAQVLSDPSTGRMRWARVEIRDPRVHGPYAP